MKTTSHENPQIGDGNGGIYLHIPFCKSRCSYCDFATDIHRDRKTVDRYVAALRTEISQSRFSGKQVDTIYFGGGTPSLLSDAHVKSLISVVRDTFEVEPKSEVTLEMNPGTVSKECLDGFRSAGINRASFGVQTFNDLDLKLLARGHDSGDAVSTYRMLRETGFDNISFDLIAGLPGQTLNDWKTNLTRALELGPEHLSLYILEIHSSTPLAQQLEQERRTLPEEEITAEMYRLIQEKVVVAGYQQYEISNFAKPGLEARHNNKYWTMNAVFGFGVSAHSFDGISRRWANTRTTDEYISTIESRKSAVMYHETLSSKQLLSEFAFLSLRMIDGLNLDKGKALFGSQAFEPFEEDLKRLEKLGMIRRDDNRIRLTDHGTLYSNEVFEIFV